MKWKSANYYFIICLRLFRRHFLRRWTSFRFITECSIPQWEFPLVDVSTKEKCHYVLPIKRVIRKNYDVKRSKRKNFNYKMTINMIMSILMRFVCFSFSASMLASLVRWCIVVVSIAKHLFPKNDNNFRLTCEIASSFTPSPSTALCGINWILYAYYHWSWQINGHNAFSVAPSCIAYIDKREYIIFRPQKLMIINMRTFIHFNSAIRHEQ